MYFYIAIYPGFTNFIRKGINILKYYLLYITSSNILKDLLKSVVGSKFPVYEDYEVRPGQFGEKGKGEDR